VPESFLSYLKAKMVLLIPGKRNFLALIAKRNLEKLPETKETTISKTLTGIVGLPGVTLTVENPDFFRSRVIVCGE